MTPKMHDLIELTKKQQFATQGKMHCQKIKKSYNHLVVTCNLKIDSILNVETEGFHSILAGLPVIIDYNRETVMEHVSGQHMAALTHEVVVVLVKG